jgi:hypothetical protein
LRFSARTLFDQTSLLTRHFGVRSRSIMGKFRQMSCATFQ